MDKAKRDRINKLLDRAYDHLIEAEDELQEGDEEFALHLKIDEMLTSLEEIEL